MASEEDNKKTQTVEARARNISHNVRCTECGSQSIEDSRADVAILLRKIDDKLYIYLEYVSGGSIHKLLQEYGQFGEPAIRSYTQQILSGLAYLHAKKLSIGRYNTFLILYPTGITSEVGMIYVALPYIKDMIISEADNLQGNSRRKRQTFSKRDLLTEMFQDANHSNKVDNHATRVTESTDDVDAIDRE